MFNIETVTSLDNFYKYDDYWKSSFIISFKEFGFERSDDDQHMYESIDCYDDDSHNSADNIHEIEKPSSFNTLHEFAFDYDDEKDSDNMSVDDLQELEKPCSNTFNSGLAKDDLIALLRSLFPLDNALKHATLGKQKATNVIRQVLGFDYLNEAVSALRSRKFSFIIDETTDKSTAKQLAILATYFDMKSFQTKKLLLDMVEVEDGMAKGIYAAVKQSFSDLHVPMNNIIGYSSDTCNVMFGEYNSVFQLLRAEFPDVVTVKCSCHLIHLVSCKAALQLPKGLEDLCRDVFAHFSRSSKRQDTYKEFQEFFKVEPHKLLAPAQTRWLSLEACVNRILEQYIALQNYFVLVANEDPTHSNDRILKSLQNKYTLAYLEFLSL